MRARLICVLIGISYALKSMPNTLPDLIASLRLRIVHSAISVLLIERKAYSVRNWIVLFEQIESAERAVSQ
jgi:hypothetical protein